MTNAQARRDAITTLFPDAGKPPRGLFVVLEGVDGCGKSTVLPRVAKLLQDIHSLDNGSCLVLESPFGVEIPRDVDSVEVQRTNIEARVMATGRYITPALADSKLVLVSRYSPSTAAYADPDDYDSLSNEEADLVRDGDIAKPDLIIYLRANASEVWERKREDYTSLGRAEELVETYDDMFIGDEYVYAIWNGRNIEWTTSVPVTTVTSVPDDVEATCNEVARVISSKLYSANAQ